MPWKGSHRFLILAILVTGFFVPGRSLGQATSSTDRLSRALQSHGDADSTRLNLLLELAAVLERENPGQSVSYALDAQELAGTLNMPLRQADALQQAGNSYNMLGAFQKQRECYVSARKIYQDLGNAKGEIGVLNNLGTVSIAERNFEIAGEYLYKALQMTLALQLDRNLPALFNNLGNMYEGKGDLDSALTYYNKAYDEVRFHHPDPVVESIILANIGNTYASKGDRERAQKIYHECVAYKRSLNDVYGLSELYMNIGDNFIETGRMDSALHYLNSGLELADSIEAVELQELVHRQLARLHDTLGNTAEALAHSMEAIRLLDSLRMGETKSISEATNIRIAAEQLIHEREMANAKSAMEQEGRLRRQRIISIATVIGLALILLLLFIIYRRYRERRDAASNLEDKIHLRTFELSRSNQRLQQALQAVENSNRDLNTFIYRSSHDLRSPLSSIGGLLDIIQNSLGDHEASHYLRLVEDKTIHLNRLLAQLMESVDLQSRPPRGSSFSIGELWEELQSTLAVNVGYESVRFDLVAPPDLQLKTDRACLRMVLMNLLMNAIDFRDKDGQKKPSCTLSVTPLGRGWLLTVEDNGLGMTPEVQARAFEMFYRGNLQAEGIGNGMGLYTAKKTVELIGGTITLQSTAGVGTKILIQLPAMD